MKVLRNVTQKLIRDKVRSSISRGDCEIDPINKWINKRRVKWNEHMEETCKKNENRG
jgi:hypothetical protein